MTTTAAENRVGERDKMEKRRALGRGLASLLPGPRVVVPGVDTGAKAPIGDEADAALKGRSSTAVPGAQGSTRAGVPAPHAPAPQMPAAHMPMPDTVPAGQGRTGASAAPQTVGPALDDLGEMLVDDDGQPVTIMAMADPGRVPGNLVVNVAISDIDKNPFQTRYVEDDDALEELANSIKANGVVQPILVRPAAEEGRYILVLGERRLHASKKAGNKTIPAMVRNISPQQAAEMTIIENLQREDLSPLEQAQAFKVLSQDFSMTQAQIAERVGLSRESITNYMRLLRLPREVMQMLAEKRISFAQAKQLLKLNNDDDISRGALFAVKNGYNIEQIESMVLSMEGLLPPIAGLQAKAEKKTLGARWVDPNVRSAQLDLERMLGVRVRIRDRRGKGKIVIEYSTVDDYERVVGMLRGKQ